MKTTRCGRFRLNWKNPKWFIVNTENQISPKYRYIERLPTIKIGEFIEYIKWISETYIGNARFIKSL